MKVQDKSKYKNFLSETEEMFMALIKLKKIANGQPCNIGYEYSTNNATGEDSATCSLYINNTDWFNAPSWDEAFEKLLAAIEKRVSA